MEGWHGCSLVAQIERRLEEACGGSRVADPRRLGRCSLTMAGRGGPGRCPQGVPGTGEGSPLAAAPARRSPARSLGTQCACCCRGALPGCAQHVRLGALHLGRAERSCLRCTLSSHGWCTSALASGRELAAQRQRPRGTPESRKGGRQAATHAPLRVPRRAALRCAQVGDEVLFRPSSGQVVEGIVLDVGWYRTTIRSFEREHFLIPNSGGRTGGRRAGGRAGLAGRPAPEGPGGGVWERYCIFTVEDCLESGGAVWGFAHTRRA